MARRVIFASSRDGQGRFASDIPGSSRERSRTSTGPSPGASCASAPPTARRSAGATSTRAAALPCACSRATTSRSTRRFIAPPCRRRRSRSAARSARTPTPIASSTAKATVCPGVLVDRYGDVLVCQFLTAGAERLKPWSSTRSRVSSRRAASSNAARAACDEEGLADARACCSARSGRRIDERENGRALRGRACRAEDRPLPRPAREPPPACAARRRAARAECLRVHGRRSRSRPCRAARRASSSVDSSRRARARRAHGRRTASPASAADVRARRRVRRSCARRRERFDLLVLDPPALVRRRTRPATRGVRGYKDVNLWAFRRAAPGGWFLTFTCSQHVARRLPQDRGRRRRPTPAARAGARPARPPPDHPVALAHPEGEYLHGLLAARRERPRPWPRRCAKVSPCRAPAPVAAVGMTAPPAHGVIARAAARERLLRRRRARLHGRRAARRRARAAAAGPAGAPLAARVLDARGRRRAARSARAPHDGEARHPAAATPATVRAALELGRRATATAGAGGPVRDAGAVYAHFRGRLPQLEREVFYVLLLDGKNRVRGEVRVSEGSLTAALVHPREVFAPAIRDAAAALDPRAQPSERRSHAVGGGRRDHRAAASGGRPRRHPRARPRRRSGSGRYASMAEAGRW